MIAVIDYGMGNLRSVQKAFEFLGYDVCVTNDKNRIKNASHIVLPGVGAASVAMENLQKRGLFEEVTRQAKSGKPFLGICLGMQLLFERSMENGTHECLGLLSGQVTPFHFELGNNKRVPHMGWNSLLLEENPLFSSQEKAPYVYFVHSYHADCVQENQVLAFTEYGYSFVSAVQSGNLFGVQFHPEKSGDIGLSILKNFADLA